MKGTKKRTFLINLIGILVARGSLFGINPLAIGYFTAVYMENAGRGIIMFAITIGIATVMQPADIIKYLMTMITAAIVIGGPLGKSKKIPQQIKYMIPTISLAVFSFMDAAQGGFSNKEIILAILELVIVFISAIIFKSGLDFIRNAARGYKMNNEQMVSFSVIIAIIIYAFPSIEIKYFAPFETLVYFMILFLSYKYGVGQGAITGAVCGLAANLRGAQAMDIGMLSMMGIIPAAFREMGRIPTAIIYMTTAIVMDLLYGSESISFTEVGALVSAVMIFLLLPSSLIYKVESSSKIKGDLFTNQYLKNIANIRMKVFSESFLKLSKALDNLTVKQTKLRRKEINRIFEDISEKLCKDCKNCNLCWDNNFEDTYEAACRMFDIAEKNGELKSEDIPIIFNNGCICADQFIQETNRGFQIAKLNQIWNNRLVESREIIAEQLKEVSTAIQDISSDIYGSVEIVKHEEDKIIQRLRQLHIIIKNITVLERECKRKEIFINGRCKNGYCITAKEVAMEISDVLGCRICVSASSKSVISKEYDNFTFIEDTKFKILTGVARAMKENVSGDNFSILKMDTGEIMLAISDGMGTGKAACEESEIVMSLLEQLIEAGFKPETAIKLINSNLVLNAKEQTFSTIDMSVVDLYTGICRFIKIGAASAFIKRDKWVETISSTTLPIGILENVDYDIVTKKLYEGDIAIMVTDGVLDCIQEEDKEAYLEKIIMEMDSNNPQEIANRILDHTLSRINYIPKDDMTVITAGIWLK